MWRLNHDLGTVDIGGREFLDTKKYRNVTANPQAPLLIDDMASVNPWRPRAVSVIRITPDRIISWGLD